MTGYQNRGKGKEKQGAVKLDPPTPTRSPSQNSGDWGKEIPYLSKGFQRRGGRGNKRDREKKGAVKLEN